MAIVHRKKVKLAGIVIVCKSFEDWENYFIEVKSSHFSLCYHASQFLWRKETCTLHVVIHRYNILLQCMTCRIKMHKKLLCNANNVFM